jgi:DHA2 family multidrug resistance protein-like MFS transporter
MGSLVAAAGGAAARPLTALLLSGVGLLSFTALVRHERARRAPILPIDLLAQPTFRTSVIASICCFTGQSAGLVALPFYVQNGLGHGPLVAALILACWPLAVAITSPIANRAIRGHEGGSQRAAGAALLAVGLFLLAALPAHGTVALLGGGTTLSGIGFGLFQLANNRSMFLTAPAQRGAAAGGMQGTARVAGQTAGTLIMALIFSWTSLSAAPRIGLVVGGTFAFAAFLVSLMGRTTCRVAVGAARTGQADAFAR